MAFALTSSTFPNGGNIPAAYTCEGANHSPVLAWSGAPPETRSFVLIVDDPDAPSGTFTHWVLYDIPSGTASLAEAPAGATVGKQGKNGFGKTGYGGPCPPRGHGPHRYFFRLFAIDVPSLPLKDAAARDEVERAMKGHVVGQAEWMGRYERK
jgi:Raf kinase inhibitor-like YbhB/YbcL family protein